MNYEKLVKANDEIKYAIDMFIYEESERIVEISGWVFSKENDKIIISSENMDIEALEQYVRADVYDAFKGEYESAKDSGFSIRGSFKGKGNLKIKFESAGNETIIEFDLKQFKSNTILRRLKLYCDIFSIPRIRYGFRYLKHEGFKKTFSKVKFVVKKERENAKSEYNPHMAYKNWIQKNEVYDISKVKKEIKAFKHKPLISIAVPVYNVEEKWLRKCIDSVLSQYYENWELCIADDCSTKAHVKRILDEYSQKDSRIKVVYRNENGHISRATNSALEIAKGEFIALMDNDDEIPPFALFEAVKEINRNPDVDFIYSDEDKINLLNERTDPHFKPEFSPDTLLTCNYTSHLTLYRKSIVDELGGFRTGYEGAQDYDMVLRFVEKTNKITHIPKVLYHWRAIPGSTALAGKEKNYTLVAALKALNDTIKRRGYNAEVDYLEDLPFFDFKFKPNENDFVTIIIPTKDKADILEKCLKSIYEKTLWKSYEIIVADNNSCEDETFELFERYKNKYDNFNVLPMPIPFNFSKINNEAAKIAKGNLLLFLNNDVEVITEDWLERMAGFACREEIGCVGAKLFYPNDTIQHAGIFLGSGGVANHVGLGSVKEDPGYFARYALVYNYSAVTAACLMIKKSIFEEIGGFEEKLRVAFNDVDFCIRVLESGRNNVYLPKVQLYHYESISRGAEDSPEKIERFNSEIKYMRDNWGDILDNDRFYSPNFNRSMNMFQIKN